MAAPAKRIDGIDFWRGFALLTIFIDHMPESIFQHVTQKNFGFSDAAELFVFLSGVSIALAYGTRFFDGETVVAVRAVLRRAFTLYWVQILISLVIIAIFVGAAALWDDDDLLEDADVVVSNPLQTTAAILALLHQLENANILPLYIALLLMTPLLLVLARRDDRLMLAASAGIYLAARAFPRACLHRLPFRAHWTDAADPGIPAALPDGPLRFAGFRDRHCPERHGRGRGDARRSLQPRGGVWGRDRRRRHPYALSRRPRPCRVERTIQSPAKHDEPGAHLTNGCAIVLAKVTNRLVVRNKPARQPDRSFPKNISARSSGAV